jgi:hypothetical protein
MLSSVAVPASLKGSSPADRNVGDMGARVADPFRSKFPWVSAIFAP